MEDVATDLAARSEILDMCKDVAAYNARKINLVSDEISGNNSTRFNAKIATREGLSRAPATTISLSVITEPPIRASALM